MYYEEKMIDGVLYFRTNPRDTWTPKKASVSAPTHSAPVPAKFDRDQMAWERYNAKDLRAHEAYSDVDSFLAEMAKQHEAKQ